MPLCGGGGTYELWTHFLFLGSWFFEKHKSFSMCTVLLFQQCCRNMRKYIPLNFDWWRIKFVNRIVTCEIIFFINAMFNWFLVSSMDLKQSSESHKELLSTSVRQMEMKIGLRSSHLQHSHILRFSSHPLHRSSQMIQ